MPLVPCSDNVADVTPALTFEWRDGSSWQCTALYTRYISDGRIFAAAEWQPFYVLEERLRDVNRRREASSSLLWKRNPREGSFCGGVWTEVVGDYTIALQVRCVGGWSGSGSGRRYCLVATLRPYCRTRPNCEVSLRLIPINRDEKLCLRMRFDDCFCRLRVKAATELGTIPESLRFRMWEPQNDSRLLNEANPPIFLDAAIFVECIDDR